MPRITDGKRAAILEDIRAGKPRNQVARDHDVSVGSVTNIARENGLTGAFDRSATKRATEAAVADNKALRAALSRRFLEEADKILDRMNSPYLVYAFGGKDNDYNSREIDLPQAGDVRNFMTAAAVAFDKHIAADRHDSDDQGLAAVDAWLRNMLGA